MTFTFRPAKRENLPLIIGLVGGTGSGKSFSALRLASGLAGGKRFAAIDTEAGRLKHYADDFDFDHGDLTPPFRPDRYMEAILAADEKGYPVIIVDSTSHVWAGDGGVIDWQEEELYRMAKDDYKKREACRMAAWVQPKMGHKKMVQRLLQIRAHLILCFRAEEKIEMRKNPQTKKMEVVPKEGPTGLKGWMPVCEKNLPYELTMSFLLTADAPGTPKPIKLEKDHRPLIPLNEELGEEQGRLLAEWAKGGKVSMSRPKSTPKSEGAITKEQSSELGALVKNLGIAPGAGQNILHAMFSGKQWPSDSKGNKEIKAKHLTDPEATKLIKSLREVENGLATIGEGGTIDPVEVTAQP